MKALELLQFIGRILSAPSHPGVAEDLRRRVRRDPVCWEKVASIANSHLVIPALHTGLGSCDLLTEIPPDFLLYLQTLQELNADRNRRIRNEVHDTAVILNRLGIEPVLIKGAGNLFRGIYEKDGDRVLTDIDILVPREQLGIAFRALTQAGFQRLDPVISADAELGPKGAHHAPRLARPESGIPIELHSRVQEKILVPDPADECKRAVFRALEHVDFRARVLTEDEQTIQTIIHCQVSHQSYRSACPSLRALWDVVLLTGRRAGTERQSREIPFKQEGTARIYADFVEWGTLLFPAFPLSSQGTSPALHRLRKRASLTFPAYAWIEELLLQPVCSISNIRKLLENGTISYRTLPAEIRRRLGTREWWSNRRKRCSDRWRKFGV